MRRSRGNKHSLIEVRQVEFPKSQQGPTEIIVGHLITVIESWSYWVFAYSNLEIITMRQWKGLKGPEESELFELLQQNS